MQTEECKINEAQSVFGPSSQSLTQRRHSKGGILLAALCTPEKEVFLFFSAGVFLQRVSTLTRSH